MSDPFLAEIKLMSFVYAPKGWAQCNGQLLPINQYQALFSLLGTTYGGDGRVNFALPNLQGEVPIHTGQGHTLGETGGEQNHTLTIAELPTHTHVLNASPNTGASQIQTRQFSPRRPPTPMNSNATHADGPRLGNQQRRRPAACQHAAVSDAELLHRPAGHFPVAELKETNRGPTFCR